jgi:hypothetical protein
MRRLRDERDIDDPVMAELAELIRAVDQPEPRQGAEERVLQAMSGRQVLRSWWWLHAVIVLFMIIAVRIDKLVDSGDGDGDGRPSATRPSTDRLAPAAMPILESRAPSPQLVLAPPVASAPPVVPALPVVAAPSPRPAVRNRIAPKSDLPAPSIQTPVEPPPAVPQQLATDAQAAASPDLAPSPVDEPALVHDAVRALRRDRDARTAISRLEAYRLRHPSGDLAEEALALLIEAVIAAFDDGAITASPYRGASAYAASAGHVRGLALEYLRRFPHGRFRELAEQARRWSPGQDRRTVLGSAEITP